MRYDDLYLWFLADPAVPRYVGQLRLVLRLPGLGLFKLGPKRIGIDLREQVARMHVLSLHEGDFLQLTIDADVDGDGIEGLDGAESIHVDRHVFLDNFALGHRYGRWSGVSGSRRLLRRSRSIVTHCPYNSHREQSAKNPATQLPP